MVHPTKTRPLQINLSAIWGQWLTSSQLYTQCDFNPPENSENQKGSPSHLLDRKTTNISNQAGGDYWVFVGFWPIYHSISIIIILLLPIYSTIIMISSCLDSMIFAADDYPYRGKPSSKAAPCDWNWVVCAMASEVLLLGLQHYWTYNSVFWLPFYYTPSTMSNMSRLFLRLCLRIGHPKIQWRIPRKPSGRDCTNSV